MKSSLIITALLIGIGICTSSTASAQRKCKVTRSTGKNIGTKPADDFVTIKVTDENNGTNSAFEKKFNLKHIPYNKREQYVDFLMDSLLRDGLEDEGWVIKEVQDTKGRR